MAIVKWEPLKELVTLQDRMNQFLSEMKIPFDDENGRLVQDWVPAVDIFEDAEAIQLRAELPGMEMKEMEVKVANNTLQIQGEKKLEREDRRENYSRIERVYGRFSRSFTLPTSVDQDEIKAQYEKGVLNITLPKREESKPKTIAVE